MNILYFLYTHPASSSFVAREIESLTSKGHSVAVFSQNKKEENPDHEEFAELEVPVCHAPANVKSFIGLRSPSLYSTLEFRQVMAHDRTRYMPLNVAQAGRALNFVSDLDMEINHIHSHFASRAQFPAFYLSQLLDVTWTVTSHAADIYASPYPYYTNKIFELANRIVTISEYNREYLQESQDVSVPIDVVHAGINPDRFRPSEETVSNRIVTVASPVEKKGYDTALKAIASIGDDIDTLEYRIIGWEPKERPELMAIIDDLGIHDSVTVLGRVSDETVRRELDQAELFLLPCRVAKNGDRDGIPVALMEAMAMETPPVSTTVSGIPELIDNRRTGFLSPPEDPEAIAECLSEGLGNDLAAMGKQCRETVQEEFNVDSETKKLLDVFDRCSGEAVDRCIHSDRT